MSIAPVLQAFVTIFPAELPDKTMIAMIILVTRYRRPGWVWAGATAAFAVHVTVASAAGRALGLLPQSTVRAVVALLFAVGAVVLFRAGCRSRAGDSGDSPDADGVDDLADDDDGDGSASPGDSVGSAASVMGASFGVIIVAEWGDLTQIATASLAARSGEPVATGVGAIVALATVAALAVTIGRQLVKRVALHHINFVGAAVFAALALFTAAELVGL